MPSASRIFANSSPCISYAHGQWGDSNDPNIAKQYVTGSFRATPDKGATATLTFNGTGVYVVGATRSNHGDFTATLDDRTTQASSFSKTDVFNVTLFQQTNLDPNKVHTLTLTNGGSNGLVFGIDYLIVETGNGDTSAPSYNVQIDDTWPNVTYSGSDWSAQPPSLASYYNATAHLTNVASAKAVISFYGDSVALYGAVNQNHGPYRVSIDGAPSQTYNLSSVAFRPQILLYMASNLPEGNHQVVLENLGSGTDGYLDLDYALITTSTPPTSPTSGDPTQHSSSSSLTPSGTDAHSSSIGGIVGGVVGGLLLLAGLAGLILFLRRKRSPSFNPDKVDLQTEMGGLPMKHSGFKPVASKNREEVQQDMPPPNYDLVFPNESDLALSYPQPLDPGASRPLPSIPHSPHVTTPVKR